MEGVPPWVWMSVYPCHVPACVCICGVSAGRRAQCQPRPVCGCVPEKMSFSFMMLTSRLARRTAALSMICSGL